MKLFDNCTHKITGPAKENNNTFEYYRASDRKDVESIRSILNSWFEFYPAEEAHELKRRFQTSFSDAFFELMIYTTFKLAGCEIEIHPKLQKSTKNPDFLISTGASEFYLEAKVVTGVTDKLRAAENRLSDFKDNLNKAKSDKYMVRLGDVKFHSKEQPKTKYIIKYIENELSKLDPHEVLKRIKLGDFDSHTISFTNEHVSFDIQPLPLNPEAWGNDPNRRLIGLTSGGSFSGSGERFVRRAIVKKAKKYGKLDKPLIVAVNSLSIECTRKEDFNSCILGRYLIPNDPLSIVKYSENSLFEEQDLSALSGVICTSVFPAGLFVNDSYIYLNPNASKPIQTKVLGEFLPLNTETYPYNLKINDILKTNQFKIGT